MEYQDQEVSEAMSSATQAPLHSAPSATQLIKDIIDKRPTPRKPGFPNRDNIEAIRVQFFDNSANKAKKPVKGQSAYCLNIEVYGPSDKITVSNHQWDRTVQLIDPRKVLTWAEQKHLGGETGITDRMLGMYKAVYEISVEIAAEGNQVWLGHIGSPPGTHYFAGQFVFVKRPPMRLTKRW